MVFKDDKKVELMKENLRGDCLRGDGDKMGSVRKNTVASGNREDMVNTYEEPPDPGDHKYALVPRAIRDMETNVNVGGQPEMVEETMEVHAHFTCHRKVGGLNAIHKKLDRVMCDNNWRMNFPEAVIEVLQRAHSNHHSLLLRCRGDRLFKFIDAWCTHEDYKHVVSNAWNRYVVDILTSLDSMKKDSIIFNKEVFGSIFRRKKELQFRITGLEKYLKTVDSFCVDFFLLFTFFAEMEENKSVISTCEQDQHVVAAAQHILKALAASKTVSEDLRKTLLDLETQLSSISIVNERKRTGIKQFERQLKCVEDKVMKWETNPSSNESCEYLKVVGEIQTLIQSLENFSVNEKGKPKELLRRANEILQVAMPSLEKELVHILVQHKQYFEPEYMSFHSNRMDIVYDESFRLVEEEQINEASRSSSSASRQSEASTIDLVNPTVLQHLKSIASFMFGSKYHQEFCQVFVTSRRDALAEYLVILEMEKLRIEDVIKLEWHCLNNEIKKWIRAMKIIVRVYLVSEKRLCEQILGDFGSFYQCCFSEISQSFMLHLLNFGEAVAMGTHTPEKMFRLLDMYEVLEHLAVDVDILFFEEVGSFVRGEFHKLRRSFGESVKSTFVAFRNAIASNHSKTPFPQGGVHHVTKYVMNYIMTLGEYGDTLNLLLVDESSIDPAGNNNNKPDLPCLSLCPTACQFRSITATLESNLSNKSKLYKDKALQHVFMMNNIHYMVQKVKCSGLSHFFGDRWLRQHTAMYQRDARCYEMVSWGSLLSMLKEDSVSNCVSRRTLEKKCKEFCTAFGEVYRVQTEWFISDLLLREDLQISVSQKVVPAYRTYTGKNSYNIAEKYIKYSVDDLQSYILDLFQGSPKSLHK
ncbi:Exocyst complex component EXO70E2 [Glycine soja]|uniref:Exocyst subunit Exo70 family protein n=3 Tax=Glycine soja TaxID=3848 RepID=A0A445KCB7_GLYSO|nr:Exocyst complex component EXO70E2 [Glycine soja]